jgi:hypothetical protein
MFSKPLLGTNAKKTKLSWFEYIWHSCIIQGWYNCWYAFKNWGDLMGDNYQEYALLVSDDPLEQCILYFWDSLEDEIYPKHFLESLLQMVDDIETGKEKVVPLDKDFFDRMKELVRDIEVDLDEKLEEDDGTL